MIIHPINLLNAYLKPAEGRLKHDTPWYSASSRWTSQRLAEVLIDAGLAKGQKDRRGYYAELYMVEMPSLETVETLCLGKAGIERIDRKVNGFYYPWYMQALASACLIIGGYHVAVAIVVMAHQLLKE